MATFILVPGGWCGAWAYDFQVPALEAAGHKVYAIDCPGHGNNKDVIKPGQEHLVDYAKQIEDILETIDGKAIIVAHSMTGMAISQVGEDMPEKVAALVYLAAFIPEGDGVAMIKYIQEDPWTQVGPFTTTMDPVSHLNGFVPKYEKALGFGCCSDEMYAYAKERLELESGNIWFDPVHISEKFQSVPKVYIHTLYDNCCSFYQQRVMVKNQPVEKEYYLLCDHFAMFSDTDKVNEILLEIGKIYG